MILRGMEILAGLAVTDLNVDFVFDLPEDVFQRILNMLLLSDLQVCKKCTYLCKYAYTYICTYVCNIYWSVLCLLKNYMFMNIALMCSSFELFLVP